MILRFCGSTSVPDNERRFAFSPPLRSPRFFPPFSLPLSFCLRNTVMIPHGGSQNTANIEYRYSRNDFVPHKLAKVSSRNEWTIITTVSGERWNDNVVEVIYFHGESMIIGNGSKLFLFFSSLRYFSFRWPKIVKLLSHLLDSSQYLVDEHSLPERNFDHVRRNEINRPTIESISRLR